MTEQPEVRAALEDVADIGPFFAVSANPAEAVDDVWRPWRDFYERPEPMADRVRLVAGALGIEASRAADLRIAGSIAQQGLAARLVSPVLAVASVYRRVPEWSPDTLHWRPAVSGVLPMWESAEWFSDAGARLEGLVAGHLEPLAAITHEVSGASPRTLRGNAASALAAAGRLVARARPGAATAALGEVAELLRVGPLAGAGALAQSWAFRRRSCCLYYKVPGGGVCGDCVLGAGERR